MHQFDFSSNLSLLSSMQSNLNMLVGLSSVISGKYVGYQSLVESSEAVVELLVSWSPDKIVRHHAFRSSNAIALLVYVLIPWLLKNDLERSPWMRLELTEFSMVVLLCGMWNFKCIEHWLYIRCNKTSNQYYAYWTRKYVLLQALIVLTGVELLSLEYGGLNCSEKMLGH